MTLKNRIALIITGGIIFILVGPAVVLLAQGYRLDWKDSRLVRTGTLVVKSSPAADVAVNGAKFSTPLTERFLSPGEYQIRLSKPGFRSYTKRVNVYPGLVSFVPSQNAKIYLLSENLQSKKVASSVSDVFSWRDSVFYIDSQKNAVYRFVPGAENSELSASTTLSLTDAKFVDGRISRSGPEFILQNQNRLLYVSAGKSYILPAMREIRFAGDPGTFTGIDAKNQLVQISDGGADILKTNASAFAANKDQTYYLAESATTSALYLTDGEQTKLIADHLPSAASAQIILSPANQIFLRLDSIVYAVKDKLEKIGEAPSFAYWDVNGEFLLYGDDHETWMYDPAASEPHLLLNRSTDNVISPVYHKLIGYEFFAAGNVITAREADASGQPNVYTIVNAASPIKKLTLDTDGKNLVYLEGATLKQISIR